MIVCLGWGSLIWDQRELRIKGNWINDGPSISVEYLRQSQDERLTLVINVGGKSLPVFWAEMDFEDPSKAKENLRMREGQINPKYVGFWKSNTESPNEIPNLDNWAKSIGAKFVIWTALPPKFNGENFIKPTLQEALNYLKQLDSSPKVLAEEYIRKTPREIRTPYRDEFEKQFGWTCLE